MVISNCSKHAGGVILTHNGAEAMPLLKAKGGIQTPWPEGLAARHLEDFGLLKFDILGLGTLRMFENCIRRILQRHKGIKHPTFDQIKEWYYKNLHPDNNKMNDLKVYKNVFWEKHHVGIFQFVRQNTQDFMVQMKPTCIYDLAVATSLHRPGPLGIGADKLYLKNRMNPESIVYQTPLLKEIYKDTCGLLVFQEQLQLVYHKLGGVPLDETDAVRKAFTKKDASNKEAAQKERERLRHEFAELCLKNNNISNKIAFSIFDDMEKFVSYSFNLSHAVSYCITTYQCAHLLTYFPDEWVTTYIDYCVNDKGKTSGSEDPKAVAIQEVRAIGYDLAKPDINKSEYDFVNDPDDPKLLIPSMSSLKYVGKTALNEIKEYRPYKTVEDLLINRDGSWRHSNFNKRSLETLIKLEALGSMNLVGKDKTFRSYKEMLEIVVGNYDLLKRTSARKKNNDVSALLKTLISEYQTQHPEVEEWSTSDKIEFSSELSGSVDMDLILPPKVLAKLSELGLPSVEEWDGKGNYWAIVKEAKMATTKTGKPYLKMSLTGLENTKQNCFIWNFKKKPNEELPQEYEVIIGTFDKSNFGLSGFGNSLYKLNEAIKDS